MACREEKNFVLATVSSTSFSDLYTVPTGKIDIVSDINACPGDNDDDTEFSLAIQRSSTDYKLLPHYYKLNSDEFLDVTTQKVLVAGDKIRAKVKDSGKPVTLMISGWEGDA